MEAEICSDPVQKQAIEISRLHLTLTAEGLKSWNFCWSRGKVSSHIQSLILLNERTYSADQTGSLDLYFVLYNKYTVPSRDYLSSHVTIEPSGYSLSFHSLSLDHYVVHL